MDLAGSQEQSQNPRGRAFTVLLIAMAVLITVTVVANRWRSKLEIRQIKFSGLVVVTEPELLQRISAAEGDSSAVLPDLYRMQQAVESHPFIERVSIRRTGLESVEISVVERRALLALADSNGVLRYYDQTASPLPYELYSNSTDVPVVRGIVVDSGRPDTTAFRLIRAFLDSASRSCNAAADIMISELSYNRWQQTFTVRLSDQGTSVLFGTLDASRAKFEQLCLFLERQKSISKLAYIDLRWPGFVVYKPATKVVIPGSTPKDTVL